MSGHNKWSQIKRQKGATDAKKSQIFSKMARIITIAARKGDKPESNAELRATIEKARQANMPVDNIERAIAKASGKADGSQLEEVKFEAYGPGGIAIIIEGITDSRNRTVAEIKHLLNQQNAKWAESGSVTWAFEHTKEGWLPKNTMEVNEKDGEALTKLLEALDDHDDIQEVYTNAA
jgi:YebC/PmpR family DNA-binding regulatory protein